MMRLFTLFRADEPLDGSLKKNFIHLYMDVAWYGILNGSAIAFLAIYAARLGANSQVIGLINAVPAFIAIIVTLPAGVWLNDRAIGKAVFWAAVSHRLFYLPLIMLPFFLSAQAQIVAIIVIIFLMSVPGTFIQVGFNALFGAAVPLEWRGRLAGVRNAILAVATTITSLLCGYLLSHIPFPVGNQIVFGIGFVGAGMSTLHLFFVRPFEIVDPQALLPQPIEITSALPKENILRRITQRFRVEILRGPFKNVLWVLWGFHLAQFLAIPIFPIYLVRVLNFSDQTISIGNALFYVSMFVGSLQLEWLAKKKGNQWITGTGMMILACYPLLISITHGVELYFIASLIGGFAWALAGGALFNYLLERVPANDRPAHLAWFNLGANAAILIGSLAGPALGGLLGLTTVLVIFAFARFLSGVSILRWG